MTKTRAKFQNVRDSSAIIGTIKGHAAGPRSQTLPIFLRGEKSLVGQLNPKSAAGHAACREACCSISALQSGRLAVKSRRRSQDSLPSNGVSSKKQVGRSGLFCRCVFVRVRTEGGRR